MLFRKLAVVVFAVCFAFHATVAHADSPDPERSAAARAAFEEGVLKADAHAWDAAEAAFRSALALRDSPVIRFNLSAALVELGKLVEALTLLRGIAADEQANAGLRERAQRKVEQLAQRLAYLTVSVRGDLTNAELSLDDQAIEAVHEGTERSVDPGSHSLSLRVADREVDKRVVMLDEGEHAEFALQVPPAQPPAPVVAVAAPPSLLLLPLPKKDEPSHSKRKKALIWGASGVAVAVLAGVVTGIVLANRKSTSAGSSDSAFDPPRIGVQVPQ